MPGTIPAKPPTKSSAVTDSTAGYRSGMWAPHERQRPRKSAYERSGTLSYHAISCSHAMQAEAGLTSERFNGTRAATTLRNEPSARPGASARAANPTTLLRHDERPDCDAGVGWKRRADRHVLDHGQWIEARVVEGGVEAADADRPFDGDAVLHERQLRRRLCPERALPRHRVVVEDDRRRRSRLQRDEGQHRLVRARALPVAEAAGARCADRRVV